MRRRPTTSPRCRSKPRPSTCPTAAITVPIEQLAQSDAALLEVVKAGILPMSVAVLTIIFAIIAMVAMRRLGR